MKDEILFNTAMQGWQCPICKRVYSPYTQMCPYCGNQSSNLNVKPNTENKVINDMNINELSII